MKHISEFIPVFVEDLVKKAKANGDSNVEVAEKFRGEK